MARNFGHNRRADRALAPEERFAAVAIGSYVLALVLVGVFLL